MEIGIKIKRLREQKRLSQMELSTILGILSTLVIQQHPNLFLTYFCNHKTNYYEL